MNNIEKLSMEYYIEKRKWEQTFEFLKGVKGIHSKNEKRLRIFMEAVWYMVRSGCKWRLLPEIYGNYRSIHRRFKRRCEKEVLAKIYATKSRFRSCGNRWNDSSSSCLLCLIQKGFQSS